IYIVNSCTVTNRADYKSREYIRKAYKLNSKAIFIVIGCSVENYTEKYFGLDFIDYLIGTGDKIEFFKENLTRLKKQKTVQIIKNTPPESNHPDSTVISSFRGHTRSFIKIQDGCNFDCSYCAVRLARGKSRSKNPDIVLSEISELANRGFKEVVLTGVHVGLYGLDLKNRIEFPSLIKLILDRTEIERLRISSIDPEDVNESLLNLFHTYPGRLCRHLHISFQSLSDKILKLMKRRNTSGEIIETITKIKTEIPFINIGGDFITGFPGESEEYFYETYNRLRENEINYFHVFPYSVRENTPAAVFKDQVDGEVKNERVKMLRNLNREKRTSFLNELRDIELPFLIEPPVHNSEIPKGISDNYLRVPFPMATERDYNLIKKAKITSANPLTGALVT
ncbi:MAG TPA: MiaB/RimO family radical SAM methylthiotransferase, partial [Firmicutes bacterium]|nr:MiaB/RimO family radical SAM methylthiotransferase [Bacillota bacterium]